ncbi:acyltransferase family protein [Kocuria turfanensis]|uniref:Acyltransferase n=1 Tax=Kocuria turfanensis TaxID=388357 RepID=A0A512IC51_9MICC|nr:acyltransferase family protein [Kocuria turfanensis]GEO95272.1 acyltransferase [Kocuria turfanensis]
MSRLLPAELSAGTDRAPAPPAPAAHRFRPEVQGLRTVAVLLVAVYHVWIGGVSGGVDVFLFISAFLMTLSFVRRLENGTGPQLGRYWARTFSRLLPPVVVTVLGTLVAVRLLFPSDRWYAAIEEAAATVLYAQNWVLAFNAVDYYAADTSQASPFQHFWSLSVQGQVFLLWPLLLALCGLLARRTRQPVGRVAAVVFGAVFLASFVFSVVSTNHEQAFAYFDTRARLWEFALGSLLALAVLRGVSLPGALRLVLGWTGLVAIAVCGLVLDVQGSFPGWAALWPLTGAALVILAGHTGDPRGADALLTRRPLLVLGEASYAVYLVHWPVLVTYLVVTDREKATLLHGLVILLASIVLGVLVHRLVERPLRPGTGARAVLRQLGLIVLCVALVLVPAAGARVVLDRHAQEAAARAAVENPGAAVLAGDLAWQQDPAVPTIPNPLVREGQWATLPEKCDDATQDWFGDHVVACTALPVDPDAEVDAMVVGNSHAEQWLPAFQRVAEDRGWNLLSAVKGACRYQPVETTDETECQELIRLTDQYIEEQDIDVVFTTSTVTSTDGPGEEIAPGFAQLLDDLDERGVTVVGIRDNPRFSFNMVTCIDQDGPDAARCNPPREQKLAPQNPADALEAAHGNFVNVDMSDWICPDGTCPSRIGNRWVYMDDNHMPHDYVVTMVPAFAEQFDRLAEGRAQSLPGG